MMKPILLVYLALTGTASAAGPPRFKKFEECVSYCDNNAACQTAFFDTISGDCQTHDCLDGRTPPDRFKTYIKSTATEYCPGTSPTATPTTAASTVSPKTTSTDSPTSTSETPAASNETSGASPWSAVSRMDAVSAAAAVCVVAGLLG